MHSKNPELSSNAKSKNYDVCKGFQICTFEPQSYALHTVGIDYAVKKTLVTPLTGKQHRVHARFFCESISPTTNKKKRKRHLKKSVMKELKRKFKIVVVEDNDFYNTVLTRQLQQLADELAFEKGYSFDIESYTSASDCLRNLKSETDIAILDYYLGESMNALEVLNAIKEKCDHCKVIIISQFKNIKTYYQTLNQGAYHFIYKDRNALSNSCMAVADIIKESRANT